MMTAVKIAPAPPAAAVASDASVASDAPPSPLTWPEAQGPKNSAWWRALVLSLLAWSTILCAAFGSSAGVVTQTMAGNAAANALQLQRPAGTSSGTRAARRDHAQASAQQLDAAFKAAMDPPGGGSLPAGAFTLHIDETQSEAPFVAAVEPRSKHRYRAHLGRAPPVLA